MIKQIEEHRSHRNFTSQQVDAQAIRAIAEAATRASNTGNMQLYSIVISTSREMLDKLAPLHFNQPAARTAPLLMTFCADINRFSKWCKVRGADPAYDNFLWYVSAATDALLASQNASLEAEAHGLGICYLGTTLYNARQICEALSLPRGVIPVMTVAMGYPATEQPLTDRLPLAAVVHEECYHDYTDEDIERLWAERESSELTAKLLEENGLPTLAHIFTERRYARPDNLAISNSYFALLREQGFFNQ